MATVVVLLLVMWPLGVGMAYTLGALREARWWYERVQEIREQEGV